MPSAQLPGARRGGMLGFPAFDAVVLIKVAGSAERLVIEADAAGKLGQLLGKLVNRPQLRSRGRQLVLAGLQKLLITAIQEPGDFSTDHRTGTFAIGDDRVDPC